MTLKTYLRLALLVLFIVLATIAGCYRSAYKKANADSAQYYQNLLASSFSMQKLEAKNGEAYHQIQTMTLRASELEELNASLYKDIKNLNTKTKNLEAALRLQYAYAARFDSLPIRDTVYLEKLIAVPGQFVEYSDDFLAFYARVDSSSLRDVRLQLSDTILIAWETKYRGWWFWKRPVSVTAKIKNESPYLILDKVETYRFKE